MWDCTCPSSFVCGSAYCICVCACMSRRRPELFPWICMDLCACVHADAVSGSESRRPVCWRPDLCDALSEVGPDQGREVSADCQQRLISMKRCTDTHTPALTWAGRQILNTSTHIYVHTHAQDIVREEGVGCPDPGFLVPGTIWFNDHYKENDCALSYTSWLNPLVKAAPCDSQFILLYNLLQLTILWVDSSLGARFYHWVLIMLAQTGHGYNHARGMIRLSSAWEEWAVLCIVHGRSSPALWGSMSGQMSNVCCGNCCSSISS